MMTKLYLKILIAMIKILLFIVQYSTFLGHKLQNHGFRIAKKKMDEYEK